MPIRRCALVLACAGLLAAGEVPPAGEAPAPPPAAAPAWTMPAGQRAALMAVVERAIAAGMPDAAKGELHVGSITVTKGHAHESSQGEAEGLHVKFADGRWLVALSHEAVAGPGLAIDAAKATPIAVADVPAHGERPPVMDAAEAEKRFIAKFAEADRPLLRASMRAMPLWRYARGVEPALAHLIRLGVPDAELLVALIAVQNLGDQDAADYWAGKPAPLRLGSGEDDRHARWMRQRERMEQASDLRVGDLATALRRMLHLSFRQRAMRGPAADQQRAAAIAAALLEPGERLQQADLELIAGRAAIPLVPAAGADLAARLACWSVDEFTVDPRQLARMEENDGVFRTRSSRRWHGPGDGDEAKPLTLLSDADRDGLVALLADTRPCRWLDAGRPRTLGDNALRALTTLFVVDPRVPAGRDPAAPWTAEERAASAQAVQAWWATNRTRATEEIMVDGLPRLDADSLARVLGSRSGEQRRVLLDGLFRLWSAKPPADWPGDDLVPVLLAAAGHAGLDALIARWPVAGKQREVLATWHLGRGHAGHFDRLLDDLAAAPAAKPDAKADAGKGGGPTFDDLVGVMAAKPSAEYLHRVLAVCAGPLEAPALHALIAAARRNPDFDGQLVALVRKPDGEADLAAGDPTAQARRQAEAMRRRFERQRAGGADPAHAIPLAVIATLLADQRPAPKALVDEQREGLGMHARRGPRGDQDDKPRPLADDLRVADLVALNGDQFRWQLGLDNLAEARAARGGELNVDPTAPKADRDAVLARLRQLVEAGLAPALKAAGLPEALPAAPPAAKGDDKSLF